MGWATKSWPAWPTSELGARTRHANRDLRRTYAKSCLLPEAHATAVPYTSVKEHETTTDGEAGILLPHELINALDTHYPDETHKLDRLWQGAAKEDPILHSHTMTAEGALRQ